MIACIYPDCDESFGSDNPELAKRLVIDHINHDHDDAHVIIACSHDLEEIERFTATAVSPEGVKTDFPQIRLQCVRCGQFEVTDAEPSVEPLTTTEGDSDV